MKTKALSLFAIAAILFTACNKNDDPDIPNGQVKFSSGINAPITKVGGTDGNEWNMDDPIGIYMRDHTSGAIVENAQNRMYTATAQGTSTSFTCGNPIYYPTTGTVNFLAYHPHNANVSTEYVYPVDLGIQNPQSGIDLMVATADNSTSGYDKSYNQDVNLVFDHQLVKVIMNVTAGSGVGSLDDMRVTIKEMNTRADFNILNREVSNDNAPGDITPSPGSTTNVYEAILLPVTLQDSHIVEFTTTDGNTYTWVMKENRTNNQPISVLNKGNKYTFNITLQKYAVQATGSINPWQPAGGVIEGTAD